MAIDNLNYYSAGLPAGQLTDRYSSNPGCLKSKNLDIFSSSKSVKATAWSNPTTEDVDIVAQDSKGHLVLKTDGKVYEDGTLFIDTSTNFPVYEVSYEGGYNGTYAPATWETVQDMSVKYEGDERKSFVVFTDRASMVYSKQKFVYNKTFSDTTNITYDENSPYNNAGYATGYRFTRTSSDNTQYAYIEIKIENAPFANIPLRIFAQESDSNDATIELNEVAVYTAKYYYDAQLDAMAARTSDTEFITFSGSITEGSGVSVNVPIITRANGYSYITLKFKFTYKEGKSTYRRQYGNLYVDMNGGPTVAYRMKNADGTISDGDSNYYYTYLPIRDRKLVDIGSYAYSSSYWLKGVTFQTLYKWSSSWIECGRGDYKIIYDFVSDIGWESDVSMDVIGMTVWNEQVYMVGNLDGDGYIIPCDLSGGRGVPFIAYGCEFKGVTNIDYLMYLAGEDRGISTLWAFNGQELVPVIGGKQESLGEDIVKVDEQYNFDGKIINRRKNLILTTKDNRIFEYGQTFGGKGGAFIHEIDGEITGLRVKDNDLIVRFEREVSGETVEYETRYQDDTPIKKYNSEWLAVYPIILGNHLLEKEESDLYTSFILPSANTSLEFWGMANHYHFWTFTSSDDCTFSTGSSYYMEGAVGDYELKFIERNGNQYTFRLEGDLPVQTTYDMQIIDSEGVVLINYSDFNHFRKIGEITTDKYWEGEFRFHNLNNKLELPRSHSLQVMVKGKGNQNYTPELFALDLVANQRERG